MKTRVHANLTRGLLRKKGERKGVRESVVWAFGKLPFAGWLRLADG